MGTRLLAMCAAIAAVAVFAGGIVFERWVGTDAVIDWSGLRHRLALRQFRATADRIPATLDKPSPARTMVALVFGQSNAGNAGETPGSPRRGVLEFYRGRLFEARDPLLGATGDGGSVWLRLGAMAVASGAYDTVVLVPFAVGAADVSSFAPGGSLHDGLMAAIASARESGLALTHLLWQQGEADAFARTPAPTYKRSFAAMVESIRKMGVDAPIYVARTTRCAKSKPSEELRKAQAELVDPAAGIRAGPDLDQLGLAERYDGCHFSTDGLDRAAELWLRALSAANKSKAPP